MTTKTFDDLYTERVVNKPTEADRSVARAEFDAVIAACFAKYPDQQTIGFTGYSPYFNDGDECVYSLNVDGDWGEWPAWEHFGGEYGGECERLNPDGTRIDSPKKLRELLSSYEDLARAAFDNHKVVLYTRTADGFTCEVDHYEHD